MLIINKEDRIQVWTKKIQTLSYNLNKNNISPFQVLLLKLIHIIIKIKQTSIKTETNVKKIQYSNFVLCSNYTSRLHASQPPIKRPA